jgi:hypothetical protein
MFGGVCDRSRAAMGAKANASNIQSMQLVIFVEFFGEYVGWRRQRSLPGTPLVESWLYRGKSPQNLATVSFTNNVR